MTSVGEKIIYIYDQHNN